MRTIHVSKAVRLPGTNISLEKGIIMKKLHERTIFIPNWVTSHLDRDGEFYMGYELKDYSDSSKWSLSSEQVSELIEDGFVSRPYESNLVKYMFENPPRDLVNFKVYEVIAEDEDMADSEKFYYFLNKHNALNSAKKFVSKYPHRYATVTEIDYSGKEEDIETFSYEESKNNIYSKNNIKEIITPQMQVGRAIEYFKRHTPDYLEMARKNQIIKIVVNKKAENMINYNRNSFNRMSQDKQDAYMAKLQKIKTDYEVWEKYQGRDSYTVIPSYAALYLISMFPEIPVETKE